MIRDLVGAVVGHVADRDATGCCRRRIHLVHADAVAQDADAAAKCRDRRGIEGPDAGHDDHIGLADGLAGRSVPGRQHEVDASRGEEVRLDVVRPLIGRDRVEHHHANGRAHRARARPPGKSLGH